MRDGDGGRCAPPLGAECRQCPPVFSNPGASVRPRVVYNPGLKRYILTAIKGGDARYGGGFGVYDAPEPWGPWTTVFFTDAWDVGPGESNAFPSKWLSDDGRTGWLVFSGDGQFSVRRATFELATAPAPPQATGR